MTGAGDAVWHWWTRLWLRVFGSRRARGCWSAGAAVGGCAWLGWVRRGAGGCSLGGRCHGLASGSRCLRPARAGGADWRRRFRSSRPTSRQGPAHAARQGAGAASGRGAPPCVPGASGAGIARPGGGTPDRCPAGADPGGGQQAPHRARQSSGRDTAGVGAGRSGSVGGLAQPGRAGGGRRCVCRRRGPGCGFRDGGPGRTGDAGPDRRPGPRRCG